MEGAGRGGGGASKRAVREPYFRWPAARLIRGACHAGNDGARIRIRATMGRCRIALLITTQIPMLRIIRVSVEIETVFARMRRLLLIWIDAARFVRGVFRAADDGAPGRCATDWGLHVSEVGDIEARITLLGIIRVTLELEAVCARWRCLLRKCSARRPADESLSDAYRPGASAPRSTCAPRSQRATQKATKLAADSHGV